MSSRVRMQTVRVQEDAIPQGGKLIEAYETETEIIVVGELESRSAHNCDAMGCSTVSHVAYRFDKTRSVQRAG